MADELGVVRAGLPDMDGCKILTRLKAFLVDQGVPAVLEHTFRDRQGRPVDLSGLLPTPGRCRLLVREWLGLGVDSGRTHVLPGFASAPAGGVLRFPLTPAVVAEAGLYELNFVVVGADDRPLAVDRGVLSVERSLLRVDEVGDAPGPPTMQEIRMRLMDSSRVENLLLDDVEFKDEQVLMAVWEPVRYWNETPPPIEQYDTRNFPFRGAWLDGVAAQLHFVMANHFRRNVFRGAAGGTSDKAKEAEYLAEGNRLWSAYQAWVLNKKVEINARKFAGQSVSVYSFRRGRF